MAHRVLRIDLEYVERNERRIIKASSIVEDFFGQRTHFDDIYVHIDASGRYVFDESDLKIDGEHLYPDSDDEELLPYGLKREIIGKIKREFRREKGKNLKP